MALVLTEEQELLQETAREFVKDRSPVAKLRELRDARDPVGFSRDLWKEMAQLGWAGIVFPEEYGGAGLGYAELGVVLEECGRQLVAEPFLSTVLLGGNAVLLGGSETQRKDVLPDLCAGERILAMALQESPHHDPYRIALRAEPIGDGYRLSGEKLFVLDGQVADQLAVVARTSGEVGDREGITLFLVNADARGIDVTRTFMVDSRNAARVRFDGVEVDRSALLGEVDRGAAVLDPLLDRATIGLCAEMLGGFQEAFERTLQYLKDRKQFGVPIGSFQALKHRAALVFCEVELACSVVMEALRAADEDRADVPELASIAKARCADAYFLIGNEGIQMYGGIGMTDEEEIGFFLKRARVAQMTLGDAAYHRDRLARLRGF
jgi:alkylation response protein AidB-like acyl-CoA dehydrogenase